MSTAIGGWKSKPGGGMSPGPGGDRSTTYDIFVGNLPDQLDDVSLAQKRFLSGFSRSATVPISVTDSVIESVLQLASTLYS